MRGVRKRCRSDSRFCSLIGVYAATDTAFFWLPKNPKEGCVRCSVDEREHSERDEGAQVPQWKSRNLRVKRISMKHYVSSPRKRQEWIRGKQLQGIAEGASSAPRLASSLAASFSGSNECPGTHCSLIEQEREDSSCHRE